MKSKTDRLHRAVLTLLVFLYLIGWLASSVVQASEHRAALNMVY